MVPQTQDCPPLLPVITQAFCSMPETWKGLQLGCIQFNWSFAVDAKLSAFVLTSLDLHWLLLMRLKRNKNWPQIETGLLLQSHPNCLLYWSVKPHEFFKLVNDVNWQVKLLQWKPCCANLIYVVGPQNRFLSDCILFFFKTKVRIFLLKSRGVFVRINHIKSAVHWSYK